MCTLKGTSQSQFNTAFVLFSQERRSWHEYHLSKQSCSCTKKWNVDDHDVWHINAHETIVARRKAFFPRNIRVKFISRVSCWRCYIHGEVHFRKHLFGSSSCFKQPQKWRLVTAIEQAASEPELSARKCTEACQGLTITSFPSTENVWLHSITILISSSGILPASSTH